MRYSNSRPKKKLETNINNDYFKTLTNFKFD